jgi:hypothetical protein
LRFYFYEFARSRYKSTFTGIIVLILKNSLLAHGVPVLSISTIA